MPTSTMADERVRLVVVIDQELRAALRLEAAKRDVDMADIVSELLRANLGDSLAEVKRRREEEGGAKGGKRRK